MSVKPGRDIGVTAFGLMVTCGIVGAAEHHTSPAAVPPPPPPLIIHKVVTHTITHTVIKTVSSSPLAGWEIMMIAIVAIIVGLGSFVALHFPRPE
jgi:hypothetical protein